MTQLTYETITNFEKEFPAYLKREMGRGFFISNVVGNGEFRSYTVGNTFPDVIDDDVTNERIVKFCTINPVFIINPMKKARNIIIEVPERSEVIATLKAKANAMTARSENAVLKSMFDKLIEIHLVTMAMTPIRDILLNLHDQKALPISEINADRKREQCDRYLTLLKDLKFIVIKEGMCYPGSRFREFKRGSIDKNVDRLMLSDILQNGYPYLMEYLHLTQLMPYVRITNSYYFPSHKSKKLLQMSFDTLNSNYFVYYGKPKTLVKLKSYVNDIRNVEIFDPRKTDYVVGNDELFGKYATIAESNC